MISSDGALILEGKRVRLIPLVLSHKEDLLQAASDGKLWELWYTSVPDALSIDAYIETALTQKQNGLSIPFVVVNLNTNAIIGSTRFCNIDVANRRLEIGYTWYAQKYQRTGVNTECKYLLLKYAFESFKAIAVEFRTHWSNQRSRKAILRLGAKQDGVLRNHRIGKDGDLRDTVVFSIIQSEWTTIRKSLEFELSR